MRSDAEIRHAVESELQWDPSVSDRKIGVMVNDGIVTLTGEVSHYSDRCAAEEVTQRVRDVRAIANDIRVRSPLRGKLPPTGTTAEWAAPAGGSAEYRPHLQ